MKFMVSTVTKLYDRLKEEYGDRLEPIELDDEQGVLLATLDNIPFEIDYTNHQFLKLIVSPENENILDLLRPSLIKLTNYFPRYFQYIYSEEDIKTANLMWDFVNPENFRQKLLKEEGYSNIAIYDGDNKEVLSIVAQRHKLFKPGENKLTESKLICFERNLAQAVRKDQDMLIMSESYAKQSFPVKGKSYSKKK